MKLTDKEIIEAMTFIKEQHNGELPYKFGAFECAKMMAKYAESKFNNVVLANVRMIDNKYPRCKACTKSLTLFEVRNKECLYCGSSC
jgi:hypothetical protein